MKIENIKTEFPIFDEKIQNNDLVYLDSANSSQKRKVVADKIREIISFYKKTICKYFCQIKRKKFPTSLN